MNEIVYDALIKRAQEAGINRYVVGAIIERDSRVLLLERPKDDFMGGIYEFPSGRVEDGESLDVALCREVEEETGMLFKKIVKYLGHFDYESKSGKKTRQFNFAVVVKEFLDVKLSEHKKYAWVNKNQLPQYHITNSLKEVLSLFW